MSAGIPGEQGRGRIHSAEALLIENNRLQRKVSIQPGDVANICFCVISAPPFLGNLCCFGSPKEGVVSRFT